MNIKDADQVAVKIQEETSNRMIPQIKAAILNGQSVQFKGLKLPVLSNFARAFSGFVVDAQGIAEIDGGDRIAWQDVTEFGVAQEQMGTQDRAVNQIDVFFIQDGNKSLRTRLDLLENAHVLLAICDEMVSLKVNQAERSSTEKR